MYQVFDHPFFKVFEVNTTEPMDYPRAPQQKEEVMNTGMVNLDRERSVLRDGLWKIFRAHDEKLEDHFGMSRQLPTTPKKFVEAIKADKFKFVDEKTADDETEWDGCWPGVHTGLTFNLKDKDRAGYKAANKKLHEMFDDTELDVRVLDMDKARESVSKFKKATFH